MTEKILSGKKNGMLVLLVSILVYILAIVAVVFGGIALDNGGSPFLMIVGIVVWKKQKTPRLFLAGFLMYLFSALGVVCMELMFYISMYGEVLMATFFYLYAVKKTNS